MPEILFLVGDTALARHDNHERLPSAFERQGWTAHVAPHDALRLCRAELTAGERAVARFDLIWPLGFGRANTFFDRMQLLRQIPQQRLVVAVDALMYRHAKYAWAAHMPETHASNDVDHLYALLQQGGEWVAKPSAGSYGRDVVRLRQGAAGRTQLERLTGGAERRYCVLQRYVAEIEAGEKRTLVAGGQLMGSYLRLPGADFRTNLAAEGVPVATTLTAAERRLVAGLARELAHEGIGFAAVDIAYPYLMEVNLANPGGLATLARLHGEDLSTAVVTAVIGWAEARASVDSIG